MAHYAPVSMYDPSLAGMAYLPTLQQQQHLMHQQQQQQVAAAAAAASAHQHHQQQHHQQHHAAASSSSSSHSHSGGGGGGGHASSSTGGGGGGSASKAPKEGDKKGRKPYTITKPRESWTKEEHQLFLDSIAMYERDWKKIGAHIPTKSIIQIRSHAQKYFIKMAKMGLKEYIPAPSRPKRKQVKSPKAKKAKREGGGGAAGGAGEEDDEEDEEGEEEGEDDDQEGDTHMVDEQRHIVPASPNSKAARSLHGLANLGKLDEGAGGGAGGSARKKPPSGASAARSSGSSAPRKPAMRRGTSTDSAGAGGGDGDDPNGGGGATRRSGRKRVQKRKFEDEEYGEGDDGEGEEEDDGDDGGDDDQQASPAAAAVAAANLARRRAALAAAGGKVPPSKLQQQQHQQDDYDDYDDGSQPEGESGGERSNRQSPYTSQQANTNSAPSTPLRGGVVGKPPAAGGGLNTLSQLSPLSQLSQATELEIGAHHLLPASSYNPKLKPYPGLHMRSTAGMGAPMHPASIGGNAATAAARIQHLTRAEHGLPSSAAAAAAGGGGAPSSLAVHTGGDDGGGDSSSLSLLDPSSSSAAAASNPELQPEFAKVYSFLGSLFDPSTSGHIEELDKMTPVNKEIVQKLMQNLATNLSSSPTNSSVSGVPSSLPPSLSSSSDIPLHSLLGGGVGLGSGVGSGVGGSRLLVGAPKHMRTSSLGSIGSLDALSSPDVSHRWMDSNPSVSPVPPVHGSSSAASLLSGLPLTSASGSGTGNAPPAHGSPTSGYLPRSFSSDGLTVSVIPPGTTNSAAASMGLSGSAAGALPGAASSSSAWSSDKSRPGFASSALVSRLTARGALSPLSVAPLSGPVGGVSSSWPNAASSPTGHGAVGGGTGVGGGVGGYGSYSSYAMSPVGGLSGNTPMSFVGSPGGSGFFSPSLSSSAAPAGAPASGSGSGASGAAAAAAGTTANGAASTTTAEGYHLYPAVKQESGGTTAPASQASNTLVVPGAISRMPAPALTPGAAAAAAAAAAASSSSAASTSTPAAPSPAPSTSSSSAPPPIQQVSPSHAGNILASLHSSPVPLARELSPAVPSSSVPAT